MAVNNNLLIPYQLERIFWTVAEVKRGGYLWFTRRRGRYSISKATKTNMTLLSLCYDTLVVAVLDTVSDEYVLVSYQKDIRGHQNILEMIRRKGFTELRKGDKHEYILHNL